MDVKDAILARRSIRKYKDDKIDYEILENGVKMAVKAPSAHNRQPWKFKIVSTEEKNKIADILEDKTKDIKGHTGPHTAGVIREVPYLIVVFIDNDSSIDRDMDIISIGAAIENMILYFTEMGYGTLWIGNTNLVSKEVSELLNVPYETVSTIGVGVKDQDPHERPRKDWEEVII